MHLNRKTNRILKSTRRKLTRRKSPKKSLRRKYKRKKTKNKKYKRKNLKKNLKRGGSGGLVEKRVDPSDGCAYSREEFDEVYGAAAGRDDAEKLWDEAGVLMEKASLAKKKKSGAINKLKSAAQKKAVAELLAWLDKEGTASTREEAQRALRETDFERKEDLGRAFQWVQENAASLAEDAQDAVNQGLILDIQIMLDEDRSGKSFLGKGADAKRERRAREHLSKFGMPNTSELARKAGNLSERRLEHMSKIYSKLVANLRRRTSGGTPSRELQTQLDLANEQLQIVDVELEKVRREEDPELEAARAQARRAERLAALEAELEPEPELELEQEPEPVSEGGLTEHLELEKRMAAASGFAKHFTSPASAHWGAIAAAAVVAAAPPEDDKTGKRIDASDGQAYNYASFKEVYGANADEFWARAAVAP